jgi:hypothetical protein
MTMASGSGREWTAHGPDALCTTAKTRQRAVRSAMTADPGAAAGSS